MSPEMQEAYLERLARGTSPQGICLQLGIASADLFDALANDVDFARRAADVQVLKSQNVANWLYKQAADGNVSAMTHYLKFSPPPEWLAVSQPVGSDSLNQVVSLDALRGTVSNLSGRLEQAAAGDPSEEDVAGEYAQGESDAFSESDSAG